ncbi:hypothetical protein HYW74_00390 [Candidatus Pacearchaeota archaeon]|nr:hypothetical protein [Candidatus Pacearchaeota archaeon]
MKWHLRSITTGSYLVKTKTPPYRLLWTDQYSEATDFDKKQKGEIRQEIRNKKGLELRAEKSW